MANLEKFVEALKDYTNNFSTLGIVFLILDLLLCFGVIFGICKWIKIKLKFKRVMIFCAIVLCVFAFSYFLDFDITVSLLKTLAFWFIGVLVIVYSQDIKHSLGIALHSNSSGSVYVNEEEKMRVVNLLVNASSYLSERRIGALITIERSDNLDSFIDKAIYIKGNITEELLTSLFFVGSATHDGAVIIRKNYIMCAGAYLPSTERYDVPKSLGTRHRAAIGLSERYDAVTIVVSEETGKISITVDGIIQQDLTKDRLKELLAQYLLSK